MELMPPFNINIAGKARQDHEEEISQLSLRLKTERKDELKQMADDIWNKALLSVSLNIVNEMQKSKTLLSGKIGPEIIEINNALIFRLISLATPFCKYVFGLDGSDKKRSVTISKLVQVLNLGKFKIHENKLKTFFKENSEMCKDLDVVVDTLEDIRETRKIQLELWWKEKAKSPKENLAEFARFCGGEYRKVYSIYITKYDDLTEDVKKLWDRKAELL